MDVNGSFEVFPSQTTTYTLTVKGRGGTATCKATITVKPAPPRPTCTISASPASIRWGGDSSLYWTSTNATEARIDRLGAVSLAGSRALHNFISTISYKMTVTGPGGTGKCQVTINVAPKPADFPSCAISASPSSLPYGGNSTLNWNSLHATSAKIDRLGDVPTVGSRALSNFISTISYKMTVWGPSGSANCKTTITVAPKQYEHPAQKPVKTDWWRPNTAEASVLDTHASAGNLPPGVILENGVYYAPVWWDR